MRATLLFAAMAMVVVPAAADEIPEKTSGSAVVVPAAGEAGLPAALTRPSDAPLGGTGGDDLETDPARGPTAHLLMDEAGDDGRDDHGSPIDPPPPCDSGG